MDRLRLLFTRYAYEFWGRVMELLGYLSCLAVFVFSHNALLDFVVGVVMFAHIRIEGKKE
jgi:hypothetical protein